MAIGKGKNGHVGGNNAREPKAVQLRFEKQRLVVVFNDEREVSVPLHRYPTLAGATANQRNDWELIGRGAAIHWPSLDLDLSVRGIVSGLPEVVPAPPKLRQTRSTVRLTSRGAA